MMVHNNDLKNENRYTSGNTNQSSDNLEFIDLSNIQNISDLNQLENMQNRDIHQKEANDLNSPIDVDNIAVDLDEDEMEQMQRIIGQNINYKKRLEQNLVDSKEESLENMQQYMINTPPSNMSGDKDIVDEK